MKYIAGENRSQIMLCPTALTITFKDNVARVIEAFVNRVNLVELRFTNAKLNACGRPLYDPAMLLKLNIGIRAK